MRSKFMSGRALIVSLFATACSSTSEQVLCTPSLPVAVAVVVRDSVTGALVTDSARGSLVAGATTDSLRRGPLGLLGDSVLVGGTGVGPYTVSVTRPGYQSWTRTAVSSSLSGGTCPSPLTAVVTARLQR